MNREQSSQLQSSCDWSVQAACGGLLSHTTLQMQTQVVDSEYNIKEVEHLSSVIFCFSVTDISQIHLPCKHGDAAAWY